MAKENNPFFILGCVRSGTTMLRDVLRCHPNLAAPEETHFYRWPDPFGTDGLRKVLLNNPVLKKHRQLDGITEDEFQKILQQSVSRADLCRKYMRLYIRKAKPAARRWFDKTPQNVYGAAMIASQFPGSKFVHIVRNPLDIVSSLRVGKIIKVENLVGACNYWNEAADILQVLKRAYRGRVMEIKYEDFTANPMDGLKTLLDFLEEEFDPRHFEKILMKPKQHEYSALFSEEEQKEIVRLCRRWGTHYGYFAG